MIIEVDGDVHDEEMQKAEDTRQDSVLQDLELQVVRFRNEEVLKDLPQVIDRIRELISLRR